MKKNTLNQTINLEKAKINLMGQYCTFRVNDKDNGHFYNFIDMVHSNTQLFNIQNITTLVCLVPGVYRIQMSIELGGANMGQFHKQNQNVYTFYNNGHGHHTPNTQTAIISFNQNETFRIYYPGAIHNNCCTIPQIFIHYLKSL